MKKYVILIIIILLVAGGWWYLKPKNNGAELIASVSYLCKNDKTIEADYYKGKSVAPKPGEPSNVHSDALPGEPPIPTGSISLKLSDGRSFILPQTISASGIRYANTGESFVFWSKGNGALVLENDEEKSYIGCVALAKNPGDLPNAYADENGSFSIRYPDGYKINNSYVYQEFGPGKNIYGTKLIIPEEMATGTNLSGYDTGLSIEEIPNAQKCDASLFVYSGVKSKAVSDNGTEYSVATTSDAGAGNRYEETVWAIPETNPCFAIRYFIHYADMHNYPEGAVKEFNRSALMSQFDETRRSLLLVP